MKSIIDSYTTLLNRSRQELDRLERKFNEGGAPALQAYRAKWIAHHRKNVILYSNYINALSHE